MQNWYGVKVEKADHLEAISLNFILRI